MCSSALQTVTTTRSLLPLSLLTYASVGGSGAVGGRWLRFADGWARTQGLGYVAGFLLMVVPADQVGHMLYCIGSDPKYTPGYWKGQPECFVRDAMVRLSLSPKVCARSCDCDSAAPAFCVHQRQCHALCHAPCHALCRLTGHASLWSFLHHVRAQVYMELVKARHPLVAQQLQKLGLAPGASVPLVHVSVAHTTNDVRRRLRSLADPADLPPSLHQLHSAPFIFSDLALLGWTRQSWACNVALQRPCL